jgi:hypothetical protein
MLTRFHSCVWLGEGDATSAMAFKFIQKEVLQLQNFDELCDSKEASKKWGALLDLMQRQWFSRRWVVQEIALAREAVIYCGADKIPWKGNVFFINYSSGSLTLTAYSFIDDKKNLTLTSLQTSQWQ